ncbi:hypothetical protein MPL1032_10216 [Mesorhizobium plurifarium]|uniref:Uncharacterized protein n=1 Tax=Mesorhizobium plurifarium TaxID=69974 RepID=A0A0K2VNE2_MESPL|nr:hypothetical protein MPL1032_10216 [Mesorhizobium plurifarium]
MPAGTLFVFPNENLARADQSTRDALDQLRAKGIEWRTVSHVDDLNDLLLPAEEEAQPEAASKKQPPEAIAIEVLPEAPPRAAPLPQLSIAPVVRKSSLRRYGMAGAATGLVILLAVAAIANWFEAGRLDPAVIQASDERLNALAQTASGLAAGKIEPQACQNLVQTAKAITDFDRSRFDKDNQAGFDLAQGCRAALAESDNRIRALVASASAEDVETPNGTARLVKASASLTDFDKDRDLTEEARKAIAAASAGSASFEASDKRIDAFSAAFAAWQQRQDDGKAAELALAAVGALRPLDTQRAPADVQSKIKQSSLLQGLIDQSDARISKAVLAVSALQSKDTPDNRTAAQDAAFAVTNFDSSRATASQQKILDDGRKLPSQLRWQDFAATVADFRKSPDAAATLKLAEAFRDLTASDRIAFNDQLRTARPDAEKALQTVADSDLRLSALASAFSAVQTAEMKKKQLLNPYLSLISAADALGPFDNGRLSDVLAAALKKSGLIKKALAESDNRISAAIEWAETASKLKDRAVPRKIMKNVQITRNALTDLDKERLSSAQKAILDDVCGVPVEPEPGMLPAIDGYDCYQPGDFAPKPLPAIAQ